MSAARCQKCVLLGALDYSGVSASLLREALYGDRGQLIFATCVHGTLVVDERIAEQASFAATQVRSVEVMA